MGAVKTCMLLNQEIVAAVAERVSCLNLPNLVVDPVMVSRSGARLIDDRAVATLPNALLPLAAIVTPNRYEAQLLSGLQIHTIDDMLPAASANLPAGSQSSIGQRGKRVGKSAGRRCLVRWPQAGNPEDICSRYRQHPRQRLHPQERRQLPI